MEVKVTIEGKIKKECFNIKHYNLIFNVHNITEDKKSKIPKRIWKEQTCQVFHENLFLTTLNYHVRPGQEGIPELSHLKEKSQLQQYYLQECINLYTQYCEDPVKFLLETHTYFCNYMKDPWCYDHDFNKNQEEFLEAYHKCHYQYTNQEEFGDAAKKLHSVWHQTFYYHPSQADLIQSGFLLLRLS